MTDAPTVTAQDIPGIAGGYRLQFEPAQDCHVLLYPEGMVSLNASAAEILLLCDGVRSAAAICSDLAAAFDGADVSADVYRFLGLALQQGWIVLA